MGWYSNREVEKKRRVYVEAYHGEGISSSVLPEQNTNMGGAVVMAQKHNNGSNTSVNTASSLAMPATAAASLARKMTFRIVDDAEPQSLNRRVTKFW